MKNLNQNKKAAVISAEGFGDGLLMLIAANFLKNRGYDVTVFNKHLPSMKDLLPSFTLSSYLEDAACYGTFDLIILQNDNSERSKNIISRRSLLNLSVFFPSHNQSKHGPLYENDFAFNQDLPMAENISSSCEKLFKESICDKDIGLELPDDLIYRKNSKRVAIHPLSGEIQKNWPKEKFIKLYHKLSKAGYDPVFIISEKEKDFFSDVKNMHFEALNSLSDLCFFLYESAYFIGNDSGPAHLASYLEIPSLVIANDEKRMRLWQPGWKKAKVIYPSPFIPNFKGLRLRERHWKYFISPLFVFYSFRK